MENQKLPNATAVLILGILSIITCCCYGIFSVILGSLGIVLGVIYLLIMIWMIATFGFDSLQDPDLLKEEMNRYFGVQ